MKMWDFEKGKQVSYNNIKFILRSDYIERTKKVFYRIFINLVNFVL